MAGGEANYASIIKQIKMLNSEFFKKEKVKSRYLSGKKQIALLLSGILLTITGNAQTEVELVGKAAHNFPYFHWVQNFNADEVVNISIDGKLFPAINNITADVYVVIDKTANEWQLNNTLVDVTNSGEQSFTFSDVSIQLNTFQLAAPNELVAYNAVGIGVRYDIVTDMDNNGILSPADFIDGGNDVGFYVIHDITQPGVLAVTTQDWTNTVQLTKRIWYPSNIASLDSLPLIVISHGWTYNYTMYDYIGEHLASYGYIVMSHWNDVGFGDPDGTQTASLSLIANIDHLLANQNTLFSGVLNGKIDHHHMGWMGHSTGGESPVRAYTRLHNGENGSAYFTWQDVQYISSICPVSWFPDTVVNPYDVNYNQFLGGADTDASGAPVNSYTQPMTIYERGTGNKHVIYVHGAGHAVFHNDSTTNPLASGPDLITRSQLHPLVKAYTLAMSELYCKQNLAGKEFFTRSYSEYRPMNTDDSVVISNEYRDAQSSAKKVIDDFETNDSLNLASSGANVMSNLQNSEEVLMKDISGNFNYSPTQPANGMTRARFTDSPHCLVMEWDSAGFVQYIIPDSLKDFSGYEFLSFRACQRTHHPFNVAIDSSVSFFVSLVDEAADSASILIEDYGPIIQTYQRSGGWQNEFCTVRIRLTDFLINGTQLDLATIESFGFSFGSPGASAMGALGIDDIELVNEVQNVSTQVEEIQAVNANELFIYPNPSTGNFTISFEKEIIQGRIEMVNILGTRINIGIAENIFNQSKKEINLNDISSGIYLMRVFDGEKQFCKKIIIE